MKKNTPVKLTEKWWKDNKAKSLVDKGKLDKALKAFEPAFKLAAVAKGQEKAQRIATALSALDDVEAAAAKTTKACVPKLHSDTKHVLKNTLPVEAEKHRKLLLKIRKDLESSLIGIKLKDLIKDRTLLPIYVKYAKKRLNDENINFILAAMKKQDAAVYNEFIVLGGRQELNIDESVRQKFAKAHSAGDVSKGPWAKLIKEIALSIEQNDLSHKDKFAKFVMDG